ncbi:hypothetical protein REPUB_Repub08aG0059300 [Reevesia pubescens]
MDYNEQSRQNRIRRLGILRLNRLNLKLYSVPIQYVTTFGERERSICVNQAVDNRIARLNAVRSARLRRYRSSLPDSSNMKVINSNNSLSTQCEDSVAPLGSPLSSRYSEQSSTTSSTINVHSGHHVRVPSTAGADGELHTSRKFQDKITSECKNEPQSALVSVEGIEMVENATKSADAHSTDALPVGCSGKECSTCCLLRQGIEMLENATKSADAHSTDALPVVCSVKSESMATVECNLLNVGPSLVKSFPNYPAPEPMWCGSFEILDSVSRSEFFDGFLAHLPGKLHHKALEYSKQVPGVLLCTLLPGSDVWMDVFHDECPNMEDVALYFFPGKYDRSKQQYTRLLDHMEMQDLVLKSSIDGVELLIFSSTRLHGELCGLKFNFLCGVCRHLKSNMTFPQHRFNDLKSGECAQNFDVKTNGKKYLSKVKTEPFDGLDISPGFSRKSAGDADQQVH